MPRLGLLALAAAVGCGGSGPPVIHSFTASTTSLPWGGGSVTLAWQVEGAQQIVIDSGVGDVTGKTSVTAKMTATTTFTLTASAGGQTATARVTVEVAGSVTVHGRVYYEI